MSVRLDGEVIRLEGACRIEEAETLHGLLQGGARTVDLSACDSLHAALAQALLAHRAELRGEPADAFVSTRLIPALKAALQATGGADKAKELTIGGANGGGAEGARV